MAVKKKMPMKKMSERADMKMDKKMGVKEDSKSDMKKDKKAGVTPGKKKIKGRHVHAPAR